MSKAYIYELDYLRAIAMLGVLGIHTGAFAIGNPHVDVHFFGLADIITRFSVPIFFFISAFGIFLGHDFAKPFRYVDFLKRRIHAVLIPYVVWSAIYMFHQYLLDHNATTFEALRLLKTAFFGLGSYHLYFMVILLWFYLLMPLWRPIVFTISRKPILYLTIIYILQNIFNMVSLAIPTSQSGFDWWDNMLNYRLNYWVTHYTFIFLLGAVCAVRYTDFSALLTSRLRSILLWSLCGTTLMLSYYYYLVYGLDQSCEAAVGTLQQLHPIGIFYTLTTTVALFAIFHYFHTHSPRHPLLRMTAQLGTYSYLVYLVHPLIMYYLGEWIGAQQLVLSVPVDILYYLTTALLSISFAAFIYYAKEYLPLLNILAGTPIKSKHTISHNPHNFGA